LREEATTPPPPTPARGFRYQPALDGVRALAVSAVLAFHAGVAVLPGGFLGVDAFFVLSGFLITSLLLAEHAGTGRIALGRFWARRARRLLPALLLALVATVVAAHFLAHPGDLGPLRGDALAALAYLANWRMIYRGSDYFTQTSAPSALQHTWSLGIEEQFYLLWPLIVVALLALLGRRRPSAADADPPRAGTGDAAQPADAGGPAGAGHTLGVDGNAAVEHAAGTGASAGGRPARSGRSPAGWVLVALCVAGAAASGLAQARLYSPADVNRAYFGTDTRAVALLIGCALAAALAHRRRPARDWHPVLGIAALAGALGVAWLWTHATGSSPWLYRGGMVAGALCVAAVIAHAVTSPGSPTARVLALAPLVWIGRISYGLYLWHWPVFQFLDAGHTGLRGPALLLARLAVTVLLSVASYVLVEEPIRHGRTLRRDGVWAPVATAAAAVTAVVVALVATVPPRSGQVAVAAPLVLPSVSASPQALAPVNRPGRRPGALPRIDLLGDSVSWSLGHYLPETPGMTVTTRSVQGCGIARLPDIRYLDVGHTNYPGCTTWDQRWEKGINADDPDVAVILLDRWELMDRRFEGRYQHVGDPDYNLYLTSELDLAIRIASARGATVVLLTAPYTHRAERPDGSLYPEDDPARVDAWNSLLYAAAAARPDTVKVIDLNAWVCPQGKFTWTIDGVQVRSDGLHFTPDGVRGRIAPWLMPQLQAIALGQQPPAGPAPTPTRPPTGPAG
jgi:peptidoglycan/LPS O-acetylase OafA/YrhL